MDPELDHFKNAIDLVAYALSLGYLLDKEKSCKTSATLRGPDGDTVVVFPLAATTTGPTGTAVIPTTVDPSSISSKNAAA